MVEKINLQQGSNEWKEFRKKRVAASDVPIIMGVSPYKTPYELAMEKLDLKKDEKYNHAMRLGHLFEPKIRARVELDMNLGFPDVVLYKKECPWQMASLDGYNADTSKFLEIKYMGEANFDLVKKDGPLKQHRPQLEMQFHVTGSQGGYYVPYTLDKEQTVVTNYAVIPIEPDPVLRNDMLIAISEFYKKVILGQELPEPGDRDVMEVNNPDLILAAEQYMKLISKAKDLEKSIEALKAEILAKTSYPVCRIRNLKITSYMKKGSVEYGKVPNIDWEQYRKPSTIHRRITVEK